LFTSHLAEIAGEFAAEEQIRFGYFEAAVENSQPVFTYRMKEGISVIRFGKIFLEREQILPKLTPFREN
jgi:hypothetical protein